ncbi:MAG: RNA pseudouridine synthase [Pseudomonadota bacterium]
MRNRPIPKMSDEDRAFVESLVIAHSDGVLAINKPSGLPTQTRGNRGRNLDHLLWAFARSNGKRPRLVHRLDTGTSGVILAATTQPVATDLSQQFEARSVTKKYLALVVWDGRDVSSGTITSPLEVIPGRPPKARISDGGKTAKTQWLVLESKTDAALLEVKPRTGRLHQIRAHLASIGLPLYGDLLYGGKDTARLMLHAASLDVRIGSTQKTYSAPLHADWGKAVGEFGFI